MLEIVFLPTRGLSGAGTLRGRASDPGGGSTGSPPDLPARPRDLPVPELQACEDKNMALLSGFPAAL
ncbi:hypothetical protein N7541_009158 [Penicillium brevicompactum]|uniref:Uncharacterized protein n=1 Tax=Penicillium brevicompactum TaxID=5074 RepID=A0A9W9ULB3_PENBR|nr:hypothetical protein N7541_009158 [Penicillium brevicompactum]